MLTVMAVDFERIRELKLTAKWGIDNEEKKEAIFRLSQYGKEGLSAIQEILTVTAYDDIKQACIDAIKSLGRKRTKMIHKKENSSKNHKPSFTKRKKTNTNRKSPKYSHH